MFVHRYHFAYYQQVAVFFWPILFLELWRVDRWQAETGRRAFVTPDKYGRAWVPYFEGMSQKPHLNDVNAPVFRPVDIEALCPGWLDSALLKPTLVACSEHWIERTLISARREDSVVCTEVFQRIEPDPPDPPLVQKWIDSKAAFDQIAVNKPARNLIPRRSVISPAL